MNLGKILLGIGAIACAPIAVAGAASLAATTGAIAMVTGGVSEAVAIGAGVATMEIADKTSKAIGTKLVAEGLAEDE